MDDYAGEPQPSYRYILHCAVLMSYMKPYIVFLETSWYYCSSWLDSGEWWQQEFWSQAPISIYHINHNVNGHQRLPIRGSNTGMLSITPWHSHESYTGQYPSLLMNGNWTKMQTSTDPSTGAPELAAAVDELLDQLQHKFDGVSTEIFGKRMSPPLPSHSFLFLKTD